MPNPVLTEVAATIDAEHADAVRAAFDELVQGPVPDGLVRAELLRGKDGEWRIQTLWRDMAALDAMRAGSEPPAAPALFRRFGGEPVLRIFDLSASHTA
jgi:quinol monooxygenase YgiN